MSNDLVNLVLLGAACWGVWFFTQLIMTALRTGNVPGASPDRPSQTTRAERPSAFWLSIGLAAVFTLSFAWLIVSILGHFAGLWEFVF